MVGADPSGVMSERKSQHIDLAVRLGDRPTSSAGWSDVVLVHDALPDVDFDDIDVSTELLGRKLPVPLLISGMTGGHPDALAINRNLARAAARTGAMIGVGSQRVALRDATKAASYAVVREEAADAFVLANLGIGQLIAQADGPALRIDQIRAAVEMVGADALAIHLNYLEELVQPEGQTRAAGIADALGEVVRQLEVPVLVKETGCGLSRSVALRLRDLGVAALDVAGWGGTSFALIEAARASEQDDHVRAGIGGAMAGWGIPTAASVAQCADVLPTIAVGGVRDGVDAAKAVALGAMAVGVGRPLLERALTSEDAVVEWITGFSAQLRAAVFLTGSRDLAELRAAPRLITGRTRDYLAAVHPDGAPTRESGS